MIVQIDTGYACFALVSEKGIVKQAPDIAKLSIGRATKEVCDYYLIEKKAKIQIRKDDAQEGDWKWYGIKNIYCDAKTFESGYLEYGFAYAVVLTSIHNEKVYGECEIVLPEDIGLTKTITDTAETYALYKALQRVFYYPNLSVLTDNYNAIRRATKISGWKNIPDFVRNGIRSDLTRLKIPPERFIHLGGHPCKRALAKGYRCNDSMPVSKWNVLCDSMCTLQKREYLRLKSNHVV